MTIVKDTHPCRRWDFVREGIRDSFFKIANEHDWNWPNTALHQHLQVAKHAVFLPRDGLSSIFLVAMMILKTHYKTNIGSAQSISISLVH
jgi:hypothetical protein